MCHLGILESRLQLNHVVMWCLEKSFIFSAVPAVPPPPMMRPAFVPHILQRPGKSE